MAVQTWLTEVIHTDEPGVADVEWDSFNLGVVEEGRFRTIYTAFDEADILKAKAAIELYERLGEPDEAHIQAALEWFNTFKSGMVAVPKPPARATSTSKRKPAAKKKPARKS